MIGKNCSTMVHYQNLRCVSWINILEITTSEVLTN